eukprot:TRINITY_DN11646_c0_g1_i1.p1 TRINITY_DN11646_c0_g1~~TRINITY_DN11646_c0_g1_i1.p1  ORF type:complete len:133 (-),score=6.01 TRINITY_DN11646_c0_g1_i1:113-511(-)
MVLSARAEVGVVAVFMVLPRACSFEMGLRTTSLSIDINQIHRKNLKKNDHPIAECLKKGGEVPPRRRRRRTRGEGGEDKSSRIKWRADGDSNAVVVEFLSSFFSYFTCTFRTAGGTSNFLIPSASILGAFDY